MSDDGIVAEVHGSPPLVGESVTVDGSSYLVTRRVFAATTDGADPVWWILLETEASDEPPDG